MWTAIDIGLTGFLSVRFIVRMTVLLGCHFLVFRIATVKTNFVIIECVTSALHLYVEEAMQ